PPDTFLPPIHHGKDQKNQNQKPMLQTFMTSAVSTKVDTYQSRRSLQQPREAVEGGVGPVEGV
ncbi:hypothetical protein D7U98_04715, partial [Stenotrophomonas maltophilia]|uniref:hypothetical protein n=1 Tax=Stenotrophomonas maltophilia TaxID=40324 RepID=UPI001C60E039